MTPCDAGAARVRRLEAAFADIAHTRMAGVPLMNLRLHVEAVGFERATDDTGVPALCGVLVSPWFMNLVWLPLHRCTAAVDGEVTARTVGGERFDFVAAYEEALGRFDTCSLFSPMFEFATPAQARDMALAILRQLRARPVAAAPSPPAPPVRRAFLFGRSAAAGG